MRVLLVGTLPSAIARVEALLGEAGHEVMGCRAHGQTGFPCTAVTHPGTCPLDAGTVDAVVTVRHRPWPRPLPLEFGVVCALRQSVPLVVHGRTLLQPFAGWAEAETTTDEELLAALAPAGGITPRSDAPRAAASRARGSA